MQKKEFILLAAVLIIVFGIVYAAYDIYKAFKPDSMCKSECSSDGCDNRTAFNCTIDKINGCYYKHYIEIKIGLCDARCRVNDDCNETSKCVSNECREPKCGDADCDKESGETCSSCPEDCVLDAGTICCYSKIVEGECCSDSECDETKYEICEDYKCAVGPYCGDGTCDSNENCDTCKKDCRPGEGQICCTGVIKTGDCCRDGQCEEWQDCKQNKCVVPTSEE